ncbi:hypothetical protein R1flu_016180 [Riccia fluitans]|uniref:Uncharacterized protein n=1 Tax=Riccia fluitans TaxID=41844 RepID=A0ABD1YP90_9MARC
MAEGGDDEIYVLRDASRIAAISQLDDLVRQGALKGEKAVYAKKKWEALKDTYLAVTGTERKLKIEVDEMEVQLKGIQGELGRILKCCEEDEVTIELVKDDAEAAEAEAGLMNLIFRMQRIPLERIRSSLSNVPRR